MQIRKTFCRCIAVCDPFNMRVFCAVEEETPYSSSFLLFFFFSASFSCSSLSSSIHRFITFVMLSILTGTVIFIIIIIDDVFGFL